MKKTTRFLSYIAGALCALAILVAWFHLSITPQLVPNLKAFTPEDLWQTSFLYALLVATFLFVFLLLVLRLKYVFQRRRPPYEAAKTGLLLFAGAVVTIFVLNMGIGQITDKDKGINAWKMGMPTVFTTLPDPNKILVKVKNPQGPYPFVFVIAKTSAHNIQASIPVDPLNLDKK